MTAFSNILVNIFFIALIAFALLGGLYNIVQLFTFIRDSVIISKDEKYNLIFRTECEGIFLYYAEIWKEGMTDSYKNMTVEVKVVSHYRSTFHKPTQEHRVYLKDTSYELQTIRWNSGGSETFMDSITHLCENRLIMNGTAIVKSSRGNTFFVKLLPDCIDATFQQVREFKKKEHELEEKYKKLKKEHRKLETRIKVYETILPELKNFQNSTTEEAKAISKIFSAKSKTKKK